MEGIVIHKFRRDADGEGIQSIRRRYILGETQKFTVLELVLIIPVDYRVPIIHKAFTFKCNRRRNTNSIIWCSFNHSQHVKISIIFRQGTRLGEKHVLPQ